MYKDHGKIQDCELPGLAVPIIYPVMTMYHPAFLSRSGDKTYGGVWHQALVDWRRAVYYVDHLRHLYHGDRPPDRGYERIDLFINPEEVGKEKLSCQGDLLPEEQEET
jgi:hypothetical protein